jgi:hypothetical protein
MVLWVFFIAGCSASTQITNTPRSSIEQRLLVRALDRALAALDLEQLKEKTVAVEFHGLTPDRDFAREYCTAWLQGHRVRLATHPRQAELRLKVFAPALGVDQGQAFFGIPAVTLPVLGLTTPELALFKSLTHHGHAQLQVYTIDATTGEFIDKTPVGNGEASYDQYTILILVNYTRSDLDEG